MDFNFEEPHTAASVVASRTMVVDKFDGSLFRKPQGLADFERFFVGVTSTLRANADAIIHQSATEYDVKVRYFFCLSARFRREFLCERRACVVLAPAPVHVKGIPSDARPEERDELDDRAASALLVAGRREEGAGPPRQGPAAALESAPPSGRPATSLRG